MTRSLSLRAAFTLFALVTLAAALGAAQQPTTLAGHWQGNIDMGAAKLAIDVDFASVTSGRWKGDITIPDQNAHDLPLEVAKLEVDDAVFSIPGIPGDPTFRGKLDSEGRLSGRFEQGGAKLTFVLSRGAQRSELARTALDGFDAFVDETISKWRVPGLAIAIVVDGQVVLSKGYGLRNVDEKLPVTTHTLFAIGSSTKAFTTFVMGTLVDEGKLEWDVPAIHFAPKLEFKDRSTTEHITPRDLVTHRSGFPRHDLVWVNSKATRTELVGRLKYLDSARDLRSEWNYQNLMYTTAGWLVEEITHESYEDNVRKRVFEPLGMKNSNFSVRETQQSADYALPYFEEDGRAVEKPFRDLTLVAPAGGIDSDIEDMTRWVQLHLDSGMHDGKALIRRATLADLHSPQMVMAGKPESPMIGNISYAMGWFCEAYRGHARLHHGGNIDGFTALVSFLPNDGIGMVVLTNMNTTRVPEFVMRNAMDRLLKLDTIDWSGPALAMRDAVEAVAKKSESAKVDARPSDNKPSHPLEAFAGEYLDPGYGSLKVEVASDHLVLTYNDIVTPLEHWHYDVFLGAPEKGGDPTLGGMPFLFTTDVHGDISAVQAQFEPRVKDIVFERRADARMSDPKELAAFVGEYDLMGQNAKIELSGTSLRANLTGQPPFELVPKNIDSFVIKGHGNIRVRFARDVHGSVNEITFDQPQGVFSGRRKA